MLLSPSSRSLATLIFSLALLSSMTQATFAGEEKPSKKIELPNKVETAFKKLALKGEIESVKKEIEDEKTVYEVEVEVKGGTVELSYTENGELVGMEIELGSHEEDEDDEEEHESKEEQDIEATAVEKIVPFKSLPEAVRKVIAKLSGKKVPEEVERITITLYELENDADGKEVEWLFDAKGRKVELELDDEDDHHEGEHKEGKKEEHHEDKKQENEDQ